MDERTEDFYEDIEETGGKECGDTYWAMPWNEFVDIVKKYGFEVGFHQEFNGKIIKKKGLSSMRNLITEAASTTQKYMASLKIMII